MTAPDQQPFILMPPLPLPATSRGDWWRSVVLTAGMLGMLAGFTVLLAQEVLRDAIEIQPIGVPASLAEAGMTPEVMARRLADHLARSAAAAQAVGAGVPGTGIVDSRTDFSLPIGGLSWAALAGRVRHVLGWPQTRVSGEVVQVGGTLALRLRLSGQGAVADVGGFTPETADAMLAAAAPELWRLLQPLLYAWHLAESMPDQTALRARLDVLTTGADAPTLASIRYLTGQSLLRQGRAEEALAVFDAAARATPGQALPWYGRATALMALDRPRLALEAQTRAVAFHGQTAGTHLFVARAELAAGRAAQSLAAARAALAMDGGLMEARFVEARALAQLGRAAEALEQARAVHADRPDRPDNRLLLAEALQAANRPGEALAMAESATAGPAASHALLVMGRALRAQEKPEEAIVLLERAETLSPDTETAAELRATRGALLAAGDRPAEALAAYDAALALRPGWLAAWQGSLAALSAMGRQEEAALAEQRVAQLLVAR